jgi:hypothetical protein
MGEKIVGGELKQLEFDANWRSLKKLLLTSVVLTSAVTSFTELFCRKPKGTTLSPYFQQRSVPAAKIFLWQKCQPNIL